MALNSIAEEWKRLEGFVVPTNACDKQRSDMRRSFYAGVTVLILQLLEISEPHISEAEGETHLEAIKAEVLEFRDEVYAAEEAAWLKATRN